MNLILVAAAVYIFNIPFGYWRQDVKNFSLGWVLSIHLPIPFIIILRIYSGIGFHFITYPVMIAAFFTGQFTGAAIYKQRSKLNRVPVTGCLIMDFIRGSVYSDTK
jgi:hypothetical protein